MRKEFLIVLAILIVAGCTYSSQRSPGAMAPELIEFASDWPTMNKDYSNTRETIDSSINSGNVNNLVQAWSYKIKGIGTYGGGTSNPLIVGNTVYFQDLKSNIVALDLITGNVIWETIYNSTSEVGPNGPAAGYGMIYAQTDLWTITALNASNGEEVWSKNLMVVNTTGIDIQPVVYGGLVYVSSVPGTGDIFYKGGGRGVLYALDAMTGNVTWSLDTINSTDLWGHPNVSSGGGSWYPPAIDSNTGIVYWPIANPAPFSGTKDFPNGASFDAALFTNSILATDYMTGELLWHTQVLAHDIFDHDLEISPILANALINGEQQDIVIAAGKMGNVYALNRENGEILWTLPVGIHKNDYLDNLTGLTEVYPGVLGGVETEMAYSDGILYVPVVDLATTYKPDGLDFTTLNFSKAKGELVAVNVNYGRIMWTKNQNSMNVGAATVVNDLVFTAEYSGVIHAYNKKTGEEVFTYNAPAGINGWPAVSGNTIVWPAGVGGDPSLIALRLGSGSPRIQILSPTQGENLTTNDLTITVQTSGVKLVSQGDPKTIGEGHIHYLLDTLPAPETGMDMPSTEEIAMSTSKTYTFRNVSLGMHTIIAEILDNSHTIQLANDTVTINITGISQTSMPEMMATGGNVTVMLTSQGLMFDKNTITVPAGSQVTIVFNNMDTGVPHNFALYTDSSAMTALYIGSIINGIKTINYTFVAPTDPGTYFFRCDLHPTMMTGNFVVN